MSLPSTNIERSTSLNAIRAAIKPRAVFFTSIALVYATAIVLAVLTLNPYFAQTWDVNTFIQAGHRFIDGGNPFDLYAQSRTAQTWPYAYPPLHAFVTAIVLALGNLIPIFPESVWVRVPTIAADIGIALLLHSIVLRKLNDEWMARAAAILWLFNPITFYDTAVQGHFESAWLVFVLLAYIWHDEKRSIILPSIALAVAVLFKQVAIVFAIPIWLSVLLKDEGRGMRDEKDSDPHLSSFILHPSIFKPLILPTFIFAFVVTIVCLPFLLYSNDFLYMNFTYVENVPVQTQSWMVVLLGLTRDAPTAMTSDFFLLRYQTIVTILAAIAISLFAARRDWSLYLTATLVALAFFLTSKKVMGYYYVMLFPFLLAELVPQRRFNLVLIALAVTTCISLSPYYASWTNHAHWWVYALLGIINSAFFVWLAIKLTADGGRQTAVDGQRSAVVVPTGLFAAAVFASLAQPFIANNDSPIRAPIIAAGLESNALVAFSVLIGLTIVALIVAGRITRNIDSVLPRAAWGIVLLFAPLFFSVYTLTKETTAIFEIALKALGV